MQATHALGVLLVDLFDVDTAHVAEEHHGFLGRPVPDDTRVVLLLELGLRIDEHPARHVAVDLEPQNLLGVVGGLVGSVGELDAARLHPSTGKDLRLDHGRPADPLGDRARLVAGLGEAVVRRRYARALDDLARLVLEEPHRGTKP